MPHAGSHNRKVRLEVELEHAQRLADVGRRRGDGDQRQDGVALLDVVFDPLAVDRDVAFEEVEALLRQELADPIRLDVHPMDFPVGRRKDPPGQVMADEAVDAEYEDAFHCSLRPSDMRVRPNRKLRLAGSTRSPSSSIASIASVPPPPQCAVI